MMTDETLESVMKVICIRFVAALATLVPALCLAQGAAGYPDKPIKLVVPYPPGGSTDPVARLLAQDIAPRIGQPIVVDNRPGAAGSIGTEAVAALHPTATRSCSTRP